MVHNFVLLCIQLFIPFVVFAFLFVPTNERRKHSILGVLDNFANTQIYWKEIILLSVKDYLQDRRIAT